MAVEATYHNVAVHNAEEVEVGNRKGPVNRNLGHITSWRDIWRNYVQQDQLYLSFQFS